MTDEARKAMRYILIAAVICIVALVLLRQCGNEKQETLKHDASATAFAMSNTGESLTVPGFSKIRFNAGETTQTTFLSNPAGNGADLAITLIVDGITVYQSGLIAPGECIKEIELVTPIEAGDYDCIVEYRFYIDGVQLNGVKNKCEMEVFK